MYKQSMDTSADPCENWYKFTCGNFLKNDSTTSAKTTIGLVANKVKVKIFEELENDDNSLKLKTFKKLRTYLNNCLDKSTENVKY